MTVLFVSEAIDVHCNAMQWALQKLGVASDLWSVGDFPLTHNTSIRLRPTASRPEITVDGLSDPDRYQTVWNRRPVRPETLSQSLAREDREMCLLEARSFIENLKPVLAPSAVWLNPHEARRRASSKALQLDTAARVGFSIPETLISNNYDDVRSFIRGNPGRVIYKSFQQAAWENRAARESYRNFTTTVSESDIGEAVSVTSCPGIYQTVIPKRSELRVTFFGCTFYAMRIFSQESKKGRLDWRSDLEREARTEVAVLSKPTLDKCREFVFDMGLLHGSMDFIEDMSGDVVFLEVNEMGQFLWLEDFHPEIPLLSTAAAFSLEPVAEFEMDRQRLPQLTMEEYRSSEMFARFQAIWDKYVADGIYPQVYVE